MLYSCFRIWVYVSTRKFSILLTKSKISPLYSKVNSTFRISNRFCIQAVTVALDIKSSFFLLVVIFFLIIHTVRISDYFIQCSSVRCYIIKKIFQWLQIFYFYRSAVSLFWIIRHTKRSFLKIFSYYIWFNFVPSYTNGVQNINFVEFWSVNSVFLKYRWTNFFRLFYFIILTISWLRGCNVDVVFRGKKISFMLVIVMSLR